MSLDVVYCSWNRPEFTKRTFTYLIEHTAWSLVDRLVVYDDGSLPATRLWLQDACAGVSDAGFPVDFRVRNERWGSPVAIMNDYLAREPAERFVKIDCDAALPRGWLEAMSSVMDRSPAIDLLGMEAGMTILPYYRKGSVSVPKSWDGTYVAEPSRHIGGIGMMRTRAFDRRPLRVHGRYFGFTEWQHTVGVGRAWIKPDLAVCLLDRVPVEPFRSWSQEYVSRGWQRPWGTYDPEFMSWVYEWVIEKEAACAIA